MLLCCSACIKLTLCYNEYVVLRLQHLASVCVMSVCLYWVHIFTTYLVELVKTRFCDMQSISWDDKRLFIRLLLIECLFAHVFRFFTKVVLGLFNFS